MIAMRHRSLFCGALLALLLAAPHMPALAAPRQSRPPATQSVPAPLTPALPQAAATTGAAAPAPAAGLCQCISDRSALRLGCLASPAACQSNCATDHYSFVPDAALSCQPPAPTQ
jgi:hypothetical protein